MCEGARLTFGFAIQPGGFSADWLKFEPNAVSGSPSAIGGGPDEWFGGRVVAPFHDFEQSRGKCCTEQQAGHRADRSWPPGLGRFHRFARLWAISY